MKTNVTEVENCSPAHVECDPGFPLTLRLHKASVPDVLSNLDTVHLGYPVIDTTQNMGLICSKDTNQDAVEKICQNLGYQMVNIIKINYPHILFIVT